MSPLPKLKFVKVPFKQTSKFKFIDWIKWKLEANYEIKQECTCGEFKFCQAKIYVNFNTDGPKMKPDFNTLTKCPKVVEQKIFKESLKGD